MTGITRIPATITAVATGQQTEGKVVVVMVEDLDRLEAALAEANDILRSTNAIADRYTDDDQTNWSSFKARLADVLKRQHALMYGGGESD